MAFKVIETQEEFDAAIQDRLKRDREATEKKYADYETLKSDNASLTQQITTLTQTIEEGKTKQKTSETQIEELTRKVKSYETSAMRVKIALQNGIPYDLADRLIGDDEAAITADAKNLSSLMGKQKSAPPLKNPEQDPGKDQPYIDLLGALTKEGE